MLRIASQKRALRREERLQRLRDADVFLVAPLIQIELLAFDRVEAAASVAELPARQLVLETPLSACTRRRGRAPTPASRPSTARAPPGCARALNGNVRAGRAIERREFLGKQLARDARQRLPRQQRARIG